MEIDIRKHQNIRSQVHAGILALRVQGRQIWGAKTFAGRDGVASVAIRLMVGVGDVARICRDAGDAPFNEDQIRELKKEFGNIIFSMIRWLDDFGMDPLECLDMAIEAQEKFTQSGRPR